MLNSVSFGQVMETCLEPRWKKKEGPRLKCSGLLCNGYLLQPDQGDDLTESEQGATNDLSDRILGRLIVSEIYLKEE